MAYTAPLKTLRITGAPRSKYAKDFKLPEHLWGRAADLMFLNIENNPGYRKYGTSLFTNLAALTTDHPVT